LKSGKEMVRLRRSAVGGLLSPGDRFVQDPDVRAAMKRQVNNCALAQSVWAEIRPATPTPTP
jgi:hypothetical protein